MAILFLSARLIAASALLLCFTPFAYCSDEVNVRSSSTLYVLSSPETLTTPNAVPYSELLFIDLATGRVRRTIRIGFSADAQLSTDGKRIYVASSYVSSPISVDRKCFIETYDTGTGALVAKVSNPDGLQFSSSIHDAKTMALSPTSNWLYFTKMEVNSKTKSWHFYIAAFNTLRQTFLTTHLSMADCQPTLTPSVKDLELYASCYGDTSVHKISFDRPETLDALLPLPEVFKRSWLAAVVDEVRLGKLTFISGAGAVLSMDKLNGHITRDGESLRFEKNFGLMQALFSDTRREAYFGSAIEPHDWSERFDEIVAIDVNNGAVVRTAHVEPFFGMALSKDQKTIFILRPMRSTITVMDVSALKKTSSIELVGKAPYYVVAQ